MAGSKIRHLKTVYNLHSITGPPGLGCESGVLEIKCRDSFNVARFNLWPLIFGGHAMYPNLKWLCPTYFWF